MSLIMKLPDIMDESKKAYEKIMASKGLKSPTDLKVPTDPKGAVSAVSTSQYLLKEKVNKGEDFNESSGSMLAEGDNLSLMEYLLDEKSMAGKINLIYIDPPFFTKAKYGAEIKLSSDKIKTIPVMRQKAYSDIWEQGMEEYLKMLAVRLMMMKDLLADDGSIWVHLDWHAVHYVKILMDEIFGEKNFINEIIWHYKSGGVSKNRFARKHDTLLFYGKTSKYYFLSHKEKSYNRGFKPYRFKGVKEYKDEQGWYTMVNRKDVWQLDMVGRTSAERTGYVTQKPETLIERILESCTKEGDLCADFFGGSGTMAATAQKMGRRWISCDAGRLATINSHKRLIKEEAAYAFYEECGDRPGEEDGSIEANISIHKDSLSDKSVLSVDLIKYRPYSLQYMPVDAKYLPVIKKIIKEDPMQLIAYWSIDHHYDGRVNSPDVYFCKDNEGLETTYKTMGTGFGPVYVKAVDIFGNSAIIIKGV